MRWLNAIGKLILGLTIGVGVAVLIMFNILLAWVATGPRSLDIVTPYIEATFEPPDHKYSVSIGETWLIWDGWKHPIDIRLRNVKIVTSERHTYSKFPEISLGLDVFALIEGHILPTSLTITHPLISLLQNEDRSISFGLQQEPTPEASVPEDGEVVPFAAIMAPLITPDEHSSLRELHLLSIVNADLTLSNKRKGAFFKTTGADFTFKRNRDGLHAYASAKIAYDNYQSQLSAEFIKKENSSVINGEVSASQLMPGALVDLFSDDSMLSAMKFPITGKATLQADMDGAVQKASFIVDGGQGTFDTDRLDSAVPVNSLHAEGELGHASEGNASMLSISKLSADIDGALMELSGTAALTGNGPEVHATIAASNIPAGHIHMLWPMKLAPMTREWITTNIVEGTLVSASAQINIAPGDLAKPNLPKDDIDALIELDGAKIRYMADHPEATGVKAKIHIDGLTLDAAIESAHAFKDTKLSDGRLVIADLTPSNPYIKVSFTADSNAHDAIHLLELPPLKKTQKLNLHADEAEGKIKAKAELGFNFFAPRDAKGKPIGDLDVDFNVTADIAGASQAGFMNKFDAQNVTGTLTVDNKALEFKGTGDVNGASVSDADIQYLYKPDQGFDTFINVSAIAPVETLTRFGYPAAEFLKGAVGVKASVKEGKNSESTQASIDLTNAAVNLPSLRANKPDKEPANFDITTVKKDGVLSISAFRFKSNSIDAKGSAEVNSDMSGLRRIHLEKLLAGASDLDELDYEHASTGYIINMRGHSLDLSPWMGSANKEENNFSFEHFPALQLKTDVARMIFDQGRELRNVKGTVSCDATHCESANIAGVTPDNKPFNFLIIRNPKGRRQLSLHVQSAGQFLKSINFVDTMEGGDLTITGNYTEATADKSSVLRGHVDINEHTIKNAPILAKIVSLASFTGIFDTLRGDGIHFDRLSAPFILTNDVITVDKAKTHGSALGMTADGTITFPKGTLDLQGTIVPSYSLNHVLGNVPLIGSVLTGGEGQGVFAARYSVKGTQKDPDVSVNPLSILTPGFLRGLFDILDTSPKKEEDEEQ